MHEIDIEKNKNKQLFCSNLIFQAAEFLVFNRKLTAQEAYDRNLVTEIIPDAELQAKAWSKIESFSKLPKEVCVCAHLTLIKSTNVLDITWSFTIYIIVIARVKTDHESVFESDRRAQGRKQKRVWRTIKALVVQRVYTCDHGVLEAKGQQIDRNFTPNDIHLSLIWTWLINRQWTSILLDCIWIFNYFALIKEKNI